MATPAAKLTQDSVSSNLIRLTIPMFVGVSSMIIAALVDTYFLGLLGTNALAAYGFAFPITTALTSISLGIGIGTSSVIARSVGQGQSSRVQRLATDALSLTFLSCSVLAVLLLIFAESLFHLLGARGEIKQMAIVYLQIWLLGYFSIAVSQVAGNAIRANGNPKVPGMIMLAGSVLNIILDPILIFGWGPIPALGFTGAAWAVALSRFCSLAVALFWIYSKERLLLLAKVSLQEIFSSWRAILHVGIPTIATQSIGPISIAIIVSLLAAYGPEAVAGFNIAARLEALLIIPLFALSGSIGPFIGQNWGAKCYQRVRQATLLAYGFSVFWGLLVAVVLYFAGSHLASIFDDNALVVETASYYLTIVPISYAGWGMLMMASASFNALGKPLPSTALSIVRMLVLYVPLAYLFRHWWGLAGIFYATLLANVAMGLAGAWWNYTTVNRYCQPINNSAINGRS